ncbi:MAG: leucine-rich repeat domain-containing protein [Clostridia bacterium]|nr:leucine-rich repeat domain-containing protein [Clostridia bacterium]
MAKVVVPNALNGKPITRIGIRAFENCTKLTAIILTDTVTRIRHSAFLGCTGLEQVRLPAYLEKIEHNTFDGCSALSGITIPEMVKTIDSAAFYGTTFSEFHVPAALTQISGSTFGGGYNLERITVDEGNPVYRGEGNCLIERKTETLVLGTNSGEIPNGVKIIGCSAFSGCMGIKEISIPNGVQTIGAHAFFGCSNLTNINISKSVTSIEDGAFENCVGLTSIVIPKSVTNLQEPFRFCKNLVELSVEEGNPVYRSEGNCILSGNTLVLGISTSKIPEGVEAIGDKAFMGCAGLKSITIPGFVKTIGNSAFYYCRDLESVTIGYGVTAIGNSAFSECFKLTAVQLPNSLESIGGGAFYGSNSLRGIVIPESVKTIGPRAFYLQTIYTSLSARPQGWPTEEGSGVTIKYGWQDTCTVFWGCEIANDGHYPYMVSYHAPEGRRTEGLRWGAVLAPTREGYTFAGFATKEGGEVVYAPYAANATITDGSSDTIFKLLEVFTEEEWWNLPDTFTLYAVWIPVD